MIIRLSLTFGRVTRVTLDVTTVELAIAINPRCHPLIASDCFNASDDA